MTNRRVNLGYIPDFSLRSRRCLRAEFRTAATVPAHKYHVLGAPPPLLPPEDVPLLEEELELELEDDELLELEEDELELLDDELELLLLEEDDELLRIASNLALAGSV